MFTLYSNSSKTYYLPVEDISTITDEMCVQKTTSDGRVIHVLRDKLPGFLKAVFDEIHLYSFDQLKYEIDPHRIHNRLNSFLNLPTDILRKIISYINPYEAVLANTCQKFKNMVPHTSLTLWRSVASVGDLKLLLALKPMPYQIDSICLAALHGTKVTEEARLSILIHFHRGKKYKPNELTLQKAASNGDLKILQWTQKCMSTIFKRVRLSEKNILEAIQNGHLPILRHAESEGYKFDEESLRLAIISGHLDVIEWLHKKGLRNSLEFYASEHGHLHVLEWGYANGYRNISDLVIRNGAIHNRLDIMQWGYDHGAPIIPNLCAHAAYYGHLEALEWAYERNASLKNVGVTAASRGHFEIVQWALDHGEKINYICDWAVEAGELPILEWARSKKFIINKFTYSKAAIYGHLHILKWARNTEVWDDFLISACATQSKNVELMIWVKENVEEWDWNTVTESAVANGKVNVLEWAKKSGVQLDLVIMCEMAVLNNQKDVIEWAIQNGLDISIGQQALVEIKNFQKH